MELNLTLQHFGTSSFVSFYMKRLKIIVILSFTMTKS